MYVPFTVTIYNNTLNTFLKVVILALEIIRRINAVVY